MVEAGGFYLRTGVGVIVSIVKPAKRRRPKKRFDLVRQLRRKHRRIKRWLRSSLGFWSTLLVWGRVIWLRYACGLWRVGLCGKCKKQMIRAVVFLNARNVIWFTTLRAVRSMGGRKVLSFVVSDRLNKLNRVFPIRHMHRKFKKVK